MSIKYTADHEWARRTSDPAVLEIGITEYAQGELFEILEQDTKLPEE